MKLKIIKNKIDKKSLYRQAFNNACNLLVINGIYKSTKSAENTILKRSKKILEN
jgi:hypothetical protein